MTQYLPATNDEHLEDESAPAFGFYFLLGDRYSVSQGWASSV
jgi:hypothetical protein